MYVIIYYKCSRRDSNPRPSAHKTDALPTELLEQNIISINLYILFIYKNNYYHQKKIRELEFNKQRLSILRDLLMIYYHDYYYLYNIISLCISIFYSKIW